jgi:hypothetical protein
MGLEHLDTVMSFALIMLLLSLQVTILVQAVIAVSGLRGWNLGKSLEQLLKQLDPELNLRDYAARLSQAVLEHPALTHIRGFRSSTQRKATAIRPEELVRVLQDLATNPASKLDTITKQRVAAAVQKTVPGETPDLAMKAGDLVTELTGLLPRYHREAVQVAVNRALREKRQIELEIQTWFDTVMDRSTERFILYTRWITAAVAFILALGLHIDSIQIFKQLATKSDLRTRLVGQVDVVLEKTGPMMADVTAQKPFASDAIRAMREDMKDQADLAILSKVPDDLQTRQSGEDWLKKQFPGPRAVEALGIYGKHFDATVAGRLEKLEASAKEVKADLDQTKLQIVPTTIPSWVKDFDALHLLGVLMTGLFLSLGAPFWYNALSRLANLRPVLAGKIEKQAGGEQKETARS